MPCSSLDHLRLLKLQTYSSSQCCTSSWSLYFAVYLRQTFPLRSSSPQLFLTLDVSSSKVQGLLVLPYFYKYCNSDLILPNAGIFILFFQTMELCPYSSKHWISGFIIIHIGIFTPSFERSYPLRDWDSGPICLGVGIMMLFFKRWDSRPFLKRLKFLSYPSTANIAILPYFCKHWNSQLILQKLGLWPFFYTHCFCCPILPNIGILISSF